MKLLAAALLLSFASVAAAQTATISGTVTDSDGQLWLNGTWQYEFYPNPSYPNLSSYFVNNVPLSQYYTKPVTGTIDPVAGTFTMTGLVLNTNILPAGSQWRLQWCPNASSKCGGFVYNLTASVTNGAPFNSLITQYIQVPRFIPVAGAFGYSDTEATGPPGTVVTAGATYWNVLTTCQKYYANFPPPGWACNSTSAASITLAGDTNGPGNANQTSKINLGAIPIGTTILGTNSLGQLIPSPGNTQASSGVLSGCGVHYTGTLAFTIGACLYTINGVQYSSPLTNITLNTGSAQDRIDVIAVNSANAVVVIQGTPGTTPQQPTIDPSTQFQLTFVYVPALATSISSITVQTIFDEGTEWTPTVSGAGLAIGTNNPYHLTKDWEATNPSGGFMFLSNPSTALNLQNYNTLFLYIRSKGLWTTNTAKPQGIRLQWDTGAGSLTGGSVYISDGQYGFSSSITSGYQQIAIPTTVFGTGATSITGMSINISTPGAPFSPGFYLDYMQVQGGISQPTLPTTLMNYKGAYSTTTTYNPNDVVNSGTNSYVALQASTNIPTSNTAYWQVLGGTGGTCDAIHVCSNQANEWTVAGQIMDATLPTNTPFFLKRGSAAATTTLIQKRGSTGGVGTSSLAYTSPVTTGDQLFAFCFVNGGNSGSHVLSVTDTQGNSWAEISSGGYGDFFGTTNLWTARATASSADTVTCTPVGSGGQGVAIFEYSGLSGVKDVQSTAIQSNGTFSTPNITLNTKDTVFAVYISTSGGYTSASINAPFTQQQTDNIMYDIGDQENVAASSVVSASITANCGGTCTHVYAFTIAVQGATQNQTADLIGMKEPNGTTDPPGVDADMALRSVVFSNEAVSFSATPTFSATTRASQITMTGNITNFTLPAGKNGQEKTLCFIQDGVGSRTVAPPANVKGFFTVSSTINSVSCQHYIYINSLNIWQADSLGSSTTVGAKDFSVTGCALTASTDAQCTGTLTIPGTAYPDNAYMIECMPESASTTQFASLVFSGATGVGSKTATAYPYQLSCSFNCANLPATTTIYCHTYHP